MKKERDVTVPPMGPGWFSAVMGTGILASLLTSYIPQHGWLIVPATILFLIDAILLVALTAAYIYRWVRKTFHSHAHLHLLPFVDPAWGTVSMGYLSVGGALLAIGPHWHLGAIAVIGDTILWWLGTFIGLVTNFAFLGHAVFRQLGQPTPKWGLAVVSPMVSATTGALLLREYESVELQFIMVTLSFLCFIIALVHGTVIFGLAYGFHKRLEPIPLTTTFSTWIPVGIVGQSTAGAIAIATSANMFLKDDIHQISMTTAVCYAIAMMIFGIPLIAFAIRQTWRGLKNNVAFSPGWWAFTFPIGTLSLGQTTLSGLPMLHGTLLASFSHIVGLVALGILCLTWPFCVYMSIWAIRTYRRRQAQTQQRR